MALMHDLAAPFHFDGKGALQDRVCFLIHGFTGSPAHLLELGRYLNEKGFTVHSVLLEGHGTTPEEMEKTGSADWISSARQEYLKLKDEYKVVNIAGLSLGGLITLILASEYSEINKIVTMNTPLRIHNWLSYLTPVLKYVKRFNDIVPPEPVPGENDDLDIGYPRTPIACVPELLKTKRLAEKRLSKVTTPITVIQSLVDGQVKQQSGQIIYDGVSSQQKELVWLEKSKHLCTLGLDRQQVMEKVAQFFSE